jgi:hypothetical protein
MIEQLTRDPSGSTNQGGNMYLEILTPNQIDQQYPRFRIVKYNPATNKFEPISTIPSIGVYQLVKGIEELELI